MNVREQQDAFEFYTQVIDQADEYLAEKKKSKVFSPFFEGVFSDQMICQDCPHRYEREQSFLALNLIVKSNSLLESLDQFVRYVCSITFVVWWILHICHNRKGGDNM